jgi:hypothetical protein
MKSTGRRVKSNGNTLELPLLSHNNYERSLGSARNISGVSLNGSDIRGRSSLQEKIGGVRRSSLLYSTSGAHYGAITVRKTIDPQEMRRRYLAAPFHTIISQSTAKVFGLIIVLYLLLVGFIAVLFWFNKQGGSDCDLGMESFLDAWWFALTTVTTIGYGAPDGYDIYFDHGSSTCLGVFFIVDLAAVLNMCFSAGVLSAVFIRISRVQPRSSSILFSNHAVMKQVEGQWHFAFRVLELRKHQLTEAHVSVCVWGGVVFDTTPHASQCVLLLLSASSVCFFCLLLLSASSVASSVCFFCLLLLS